MRDVQILGAQLASLDVGECGAEPRLDVEVRAGLVPPSEAFESSVELENRVVVELQAIRPNRLLALVVILGPELEDLLLRPEGSLHCQLDDNIPEIGPVMWHLMIMAEVHEVGTRVRVRSLVAPPAHILRPSGRHDRDKAKNEEQCG